MVASECGDVLLQIVGVNNTQCVEAFGHFKGLVVFRLPAFQGRHKLGPHLRFFGSLGQRFVDLASLLKGLAGLGDVFILVLADLWVQAGDGQRSQARADVLQLFFHGQGRENAG